MLRYAGLILIQVMHAFRPLDNRMPIHGNSSVVISAVCHLPIVSETESKEVVYQDEAEHTATQPLIWRVTTQPAAGSEFAHRIDEGTQRAVGHCSFMDVVVELPEAGKHYR